MEKAQFLLFSTRGHSTLSELTLNSVQKSSMVSWAAVQVQFLSNELNLSWLLSSMPWTELELNFLNFIQLCLSLAKNAGKKGCSRVLIRNMSLLLVRKNIVKRVDSTKCSLWKVQLERAFLLNTVPNGRLFWSIFEEAYAAAAAATAHTKFAWGYHKSSCGEISAFEVPTTNKTGFFKKPFCLFVDLNDFKANPHGNTFCHLRQCMFLLASKW